MTRPGGAKPSATALYVLFPDVSFDEPLLSVPVDSLQALEVLADLAPALSNLKSLSTVRDELARRVD
jgi:hypothetical protein